MNKAILLLMLSLSILLSGCKLNSHKVQPVQPLVMKDVALYLDDTKKKEVQGDFDKLIKVWIIPNFKLGSDKTYYYLKPFYRYTNGGSSYQWKGKSYKELNTKAFLQGFSEFCKSQGFSLQNTSSSFSKEPAEAFTCIDSNNVELAQIKINDENLIFNTPARIKKEKLLSEFADKRKVHFTQNTGYNGPTGELHLKDGRKYEFIRIGNFTSKKDIIISVRDLQNNLTPIKDLYMDDISSFRINSSSLATDIILRNGSRYDMKKPDNNAVFEVDNNDYSWFNQQFVIKDPMDGELYIMLNSDRYIEKVIIHEPKLWKHLKLEPLRGGGGKAFRKNSVETHQKKIKSLKSEFSNEGHSHLLPKSGDTVSEHLYSSVISNLKRFTRECEGYEHIKGVEKSKLIDIQDCYQAQKELNWIYKGYPLGVIETPIAYHSLLLTIKKDLGSSNQTVLPFSNW